LLVCLVLACSSGGSGEGSVVCSGNCDCSPPARVCIDGRCADGCLSTGCPVGSYCDSGSGLCFPEAPKACQRDLDCSPPDRICVQGLCAPGCSLTCCFGGTLCNGETGYCVTDPAYGCRNDRDCDPPATTCREGRCLTPTYCLADVDCDGPAKTCQGGVCLDGCLTHGCPAGQACVPTTGHCDAGEVVVSPEAHEVVEPVDAVEPADTESHDTATPTPCSNDTNCAPPVTICKDHACAPGCLTVACTTGEQCDPSTGRCVDTPEPCQVDLACDPPASICELGACVPGCGTSGCPAGVECDAATGHCLHKKNLGDLCSSGGECATGMCIQVAFTTGASYFVCVMPCCGGSDCPAGFGCMQQPGLKFCIPATIYPGATFQVADGGSCTNATQCQSGSCDVGKSRCVETCCQTGDCMLAGLDTCQWWAATETSPVVRLCDLDQAQYHWACMEYPNCTVPVGAACQSDFECQTLMCDNVYGSSGHLCAGFCCANADCPAGTACRQYAEKGIGGGDPLIAALCLKQGTVAEGQPCTAGADCATGDCLDGACRRLCCSAADCQAGEACRLTIKDDATSGVSSYATYCQ
jgi:hypothetical protein